ncbi:MAG: hypothetical protein ACRDM7_06210 [Thermoleophilaceae bacterium]
MATRTDSPAKSPAKAPPAGQTRRDPPEPVPTWRNTRPRGNPEIDKRDLERSRERFEALLGR